MYSKNMYFLRTLIFISFVIQITLFVELLINESKNNNYYLDVKKLIVT